MSTPKVFYRIEGLITPMKGCELVGQRFGRLEVIKQAQSAGGNRRWVCKCDCGNLTTVRSGDLRSGDTKSCGCLRREIMCTRRDLSRHPIYSAWYSMKNRCFNPSAHNYLDYGGRGVTVCEEWKNDFISFYEWSIVNGWKKGLSIDRINNDGDYEPSNCRWTTNVEQSRNKRNNSYLTLNGRTQTLCQWSNELGISHQAIGYRLKKGWSVEEALSKPKVLRGGQNDSEVL